jgi:hypothetical protein
MISTLYSTAEHRAGSLAQRIHFQQLEGARGPIGAMAVIAIATALLIAVGNALGILISNTDSAAPAGVYRVVRTGACAATRSRWARLWVLSPAIASRSNPDGLR